MTTETPMRTVLADGGVASVRTLHPTDAAEVLALHLRMTDDDRYLRFFGFGTAMLDKLTTRMSEDSGVRHVGVGCFLRGELVGVAHYEVLADPAVAEVAVVVDGAAQAHGVATALLENLVALARRRGVRQFVAEVLAENSKMLRVFADLGLPFRATWDGPEREVTLLLDPTEHYLDAVTRRDAVADSASLAHLFVPSSVAVIGAGRRAGSVGHSVLANLLDSGYPGVVRVVNPNAAEILGVPCSPSVEELPATPELAIICLPADAAAAAVDACGRRGVKAVVLISSGLTGTPAGPRVRQAARRYGMRLVGPNCLGVATTEPGHALNATFLRDRVPAGNVGLATQSGGVGITLTESLSHLGLGLSNLVSTGDKYDVSGNDLLLWWMGDVRTRIAVLYLESFGNPRKFSRLARMLARTKPVLAVRAGSGDAAQTAAMSHTAASATPAVTRDALYEQAGVIAVDTVVELVDVIAALSWQPLPNGRRVAILSNAGGAGVLAADACERSGLTLVHLSETTTERLRAVLPAQASVYNPVDTTAGIHSEQFGEALRLVLADEHVDAVIVVTVPTAVSDPGDAITGSLLATGKMVLAVRPGQQARVTSVMSGGGVAVTASYDDPASAAAVLGHLVAYTEWLRRPEDSVVLPSDINVDALSLLLRSRLGEGDGWMAPTDAAELLRLSGIAFVSTRYATDDDTAVAAFDQLGAPLVVKADATGLLHKSTGGGVALGVSDAAGVRAAMGTFRRRFGAAFRGVVLQPMLPPGRELLVGVRSDAVFGPLVVFGLGGVDTDLVADRCARLAPLTGTDADLLLDGLRASARLWSSGIDRAAIRDVLLRVSRLAELVPEIAELDLNPVVMTGTGCVAVDVRVRLEHREPVDPLHRT